MEKNSWNNTDISLDKSSLNERELEATMDMKEIRGVVKENETEAKRVLLAFPNLDMKVLSFFEENTRTDGSINITRFKRNSLFLNKEGVCFDNGKIITTRGYDYVSSLDISLTSAQKIRKYQETVSEIVEDFKNDNLDKIEKLILLDYLKNSLVTILNSFVYQEKLGSQNVDVSTEYEILRSELMVSIEDSIHCSVDLVLNKSLNETQAIDFDKIIATVSGVVNALNSYHFEYKLPSFYVSRPEATHPLTIMGASLLCAERYKDVDAVVGVPSGGTEFSFTVKAFLNKLGNSNVKLVLLPVSLHSLKQFSGESGKSISLDASIKKYFGDSVNSVLVCDDNTSTGRTLQLLKDSILETFPQMKVYCAVAEADVTRSQIDKDNEKRTHVANKAIYTDSVNILPVSKNLDKKVDLKEIIEKRKIISYYRNMEEKSLNLVDQIFAKVMAHVNESGLDYSSFNQEDAVLSFHGTFLSNFYVSPVVLEGKIYPTVEHAYQAAKFFTVDWNTVQQNVKDEIQEALKLRGYAAPVIYGNELFIDTKIAAGNIKIIADILRKYGYVDKEWEDKRIKIMISLLLQKFGQEELLSRLKETEGKELIEGNTWDDTLWGVSEGKGRNILGIILMEIRKLNKGKIAH